MNDIEKAIEELEKLSRYAEKLKNPDEFFHHMQGHTTELSFVLSAFGLSEISKSIKKVLEKQLNSSWIPVSERLPEENIDNITNDFLAYNVSLKFEYAECTRTYKFGRGKWWNHGADMTEYVIAWQPLPQPYKEGNNG